MDRWDTLFLRTLSADPNPVLVAATLECLSDTCERSGASFAVEPRPWVVPGAGVFTAGLSSPSHDAILLGPGRAAQRVLDQDVEGGRSSGGRRLFEDERREGGGDELLFTESSINRNAQ